jgi:hypothetical protein
MDTNEPRSREITRREALGWLGVGAAAGASDEVLRRIMVDKPATVSRIRPKRPPLCRGGWRARGALSRRVRPAAADAVVATYPALDRTALADRWKRN